MGELSPESQAIVDGHLVVKNVKVPWGPMEEETPLFHPQTGERITEPVLYAIINLLSWMEKADGYATSSDRLCLWYERQLMSSMVIAAKGDFELDMPEFERGTVAAWAQWRRPPSRDQRVLLYDGPLSQLWMAFPMASYGRVIVFCSTISSRYGPEEP